MIFNRIRLKNFRQHKDLEVTVEGHMIAVLGKNGCLAKGTPVKMADGSVKNVEDVKAGDRVLAFDNSKMELTCGTVYEMIRTSHKPKPMLEVTINGEKTCTTYDHPFFAGDGFYPLYQLVWGALETSQRTRLKLLCEQYGSPFDDSTVWQQDSSRDEASARPEWVLQDDARWAYREGTQDRCGELAGKSAWVASGEPYRLQSIKQQGGEPGVVQREVQCVVWGNPWQNKSSKTSGAFAGGGGTTEKAVEREEGSISLQGEGSRNEADSRVGDTAGNTSGEKVEPWKHCGHSLWVKVLDAAPYYTVRMREAPYAYCIGRRNCHLVHNSGKSNFLGAIQFALTGEQPGFTKDQLLSWGESAGYVELEFEHNGHTCLIQRRIEKPAVTLKVDGDVYSGVKKVEEVMQNVLQIDKDVLKQSVFVRQTEIESVLFTDPRERELAFQKLIGLGDAAKHNKFLTDFLSAADEPRSMDDEIERQTQLVASQTAELDRLRGECAKLSEALEKFGDEKSIENEQRLLQSRIVAIDSVIGVMDDASKAEERLVKFDSEYGKLASSEKTDTSAMKDEVEKIKKAISDTDAALARNKERDRAKMYLCMSESELASVPEDLDKMIAEYERRHTELIEADAELKRLDKMLAEAPDGNVCPLCGSTTDHNIKAEIQAERDSVHRRRDELSSWALNHAGVYTLRDKRTKSLSEVATWREQVEKLGAVEPTQDRNALTEQLAKASKELDEAEHRNSNATYYSAKREEIANAVELAKEKLSKALEKLPPRDGGYTMDMLNAARASISSRSESLRSRLSDISLLKVNKAQLEGGISQVEKAIEAAKSSIEELKRINSDNRIRAEKLQVVRDVKDWFSYKNGPRVMTNAIIGLLTEETNKFLGQFGAAFTVVPIEEGMGFRCVFTDGRQMPNPPPEASMLSGGQKIALAVSFRFAVYTMFSGKLGFLSLDEPTAYLDDETIVRFADMLSKIRDLARNSGIQVMLSTHEQALSGSFDQTIQIGR